MEFEGYRDIFLFEFQKRQKNTIYYYFTLFELVVPYPEKSQIYRLAKELTRHAKPGSPSRFYTRNWWPFPLQQLDSIKNIL